MTHILTAVVAIALAALLVWYFTGALRNAWWTRRKRRTYGKMVTIKPHSQRHTNRRTPKSR